MAGTLEITEFRGIKFVNVGKLRAFVDVVFNDALVVKGYKVIEGGKGLFVASPARETTAKDSNEKQWNDVVYLTKESNLRDAIHGKILAHYKERLASGAVSTSTPDATGI